MRTTRAQHACCDSSPISAEWLKATHSGYVECQRELVRGLHLVPRPRDARGLFRLRAERWEWSGLSPVLYGYRYSVYLRIARMVLTEKGVTYRQVEVNPFAADMPKEYLDLHPFGRVPALVHGDFALHETEAITRYVDEAFCGPALQSIEPRQRARMAQIISIIDSYGYVPMVRQVFSQRIFGPCLGRATDEAQLRAGIENSLRVLSALESIAALDGPIAGGAVWSLADFHLAPMMAYFTAAPEGEEAIARHPKMSAWWDVMRQRGSLGETDPGLPDQLGGELLTAPAT
jgi:glutathione S-transferase